jgi:hypothetical protein
MKRVYFTVTPRVRDKDGIADSDAAEVGLDAAFHIDSLFLALTLLDPQKLGEFAETDSSTLADILESLAGLGSALVSVILARLEQLERARKQTLEGEGGER